MTLPLTEQLSRIQIRDPKVFSMANSPAVASATVQSDLYKALECLTVDFFKLQNQAFHYLHQRSAPMTQIQVKHEEMHVELSRLNDQIRGVWKRARDVCAYIPRLVKPEEKACALSMMMGIEMVASHMHRGSVELCTLLNDIPRNEALEYYKTVVRDCEALVKCATVDEKVSGLIKVFTSVAVKIDQKSTAAVSEVYDTILLYIRYAAICFTREAAGNAKLLQELQNLDGFIKGKFSAPAVELEAKNVVAENVHAPEIKYLAASSKVELPNENKFRNGDWKTWLTTFPFARYAPIVNQKDSLQGIAQALYRMECSILNRMKTVSTNDLEQDIAICQGLERLIGVQLQSLAQVPIAKEIHAGWYYVAALQTQAKVLKASLHHFKEMATTTFAKELEVLNRLSKVQPESTKCVTVTKIMEVWQLAQEITALPVNRIELSKVIDQTLASLGADVSSFSADELKVPNLVFTKAFMWGDEMSDAVQMYLLKGFLKYLHFPQGAERQLDPRFDAAFFMLKCDKVYKDGFALWVASSQEFKQMHDAYMSLSDLTSNVFLSNAMSNVASTLLARPLSSPADVMERIKKANESTAKLVVKNTPNEQIRFAWIRQLIQDFEDEFKNFLAE